jgi:DNA-binding NtrC family response regulator
VKVLVVEDDESLASVIQLMLEFEGYEVKLGINGKEGYKAYLQFRPSLVITDIVMPEENGIEMVNRIRGHDPRIKNLYISGHLNKFRAHLEEEMEKFPVNFLGKPFSRKELINQIRQLAS